MCGVAGLVAKTPEARESLGSSLATMLEPLARRGPDSAGFALYDGEVAAGWSRVSLLDPRGERAFDLLAEALAAELGEAVVRIDWGDAAVLAATAEPDQLVARVAALAPELLTLGFGRTVEVCKRVGEPIGLIEASGLRGRSGTHAIAHTRMATESRVSTVHSHPFCSAADLCLVHNGSLSNHSAVRRALLGEGVRFDSDNDSEVAARYLAWRLAGGADLATALAGALEDLDGFFTFAVADAEGFAVLRDRFACKPALLAETDEWVALASEQAAIVALPGGAEAEVREAEPGRVYHWTLAGAAA
jgi:glutamate synthase domain-containing protein 1